MRNASELQFAFDIFKRFAVVISARDEGTIAIEGKKYRRSFSSRAVTFEEQYRGVLARDTLHAFHISVERGEKGGTGFPKKGKREAGCRLPVRLAARTHIRPREYDKLCEEADLATHSVEGPP